MICSLTTRSASTICALVDHILRIELQAVHRLGRPIQKVAVYDTGDVALVIGEVGDCVELLQRLTDAEYRKREHVVEARGLRDRATFGEVAIDEADHRLGGVAAVDQEFGNSGRSRSNR